MSDSQSTPTLWSGCLSPFYHLFSTSFRCSLFPMHCGSPPLIHSCNLLVASSPLACLLAPKPTHLTRTPSESLVVLVNRLHHICIESAPTHPPNPPPGTIHWKGGRFMDEGSHGGRMVCKELDVTSTHELLSHTLLCVTDPALHQHWEYGNLRRAASIASLWNRFGIWKSNRSQSQPLPHLLCSTPLPAGSHTC